MNLFVLQIFLMYLAFVYNLSLNESTFRFRGQANYDWKLQPSIYRNNSFKRHQTPTPTFVHHSLMTNGSGKTKPPAFYLKKLQ